MTNTVSSGFEIVQMEVGLGQNLVEILACKQTGMAALIDPALEVDRILDRVQQNGWTVSTILITHTHEDHISGLDEAFDATNATVYCHPVERDTVARLASKVAVVEDQQELFVGKSSLRAIYTPGHMPGCICWYAANPGAVFTGDVLFVGSCGGVNYPQSDPWAMFESLHKKLGRLPELTRMYPGHDYGKTSTSTLAWEFANNPALLAADLESFCAYKGVPIPKSDRSRGLV